MFLNFFIKCFKVTTAISKNRTKELLLAVAMITTCFASSGGMIFALFSTTEITYWTVTWAIFLCAGFANSLQVMTKMHEKKLLRIIGGIFSEHQKFPDFVNKNVTRKAEAEAEHKFGTRIFILMFSLGVYIPSPYLNFIIKPGIAFEDPGLQIIPYFHPWWKPHTATQFISKNLFEMLICCTTILSYYNFVTFMVYAVSNVQTHIQEINHSFRIAIEKNVKKYMVYADFRIAFFYKCGSYIPKYHSQKWQHDFEHSAHEELVKLIRYQQFLHSQVSDIVSFLNKPFSSLLIWYISATISFCYAFLQVSENYFFIVQIMILVGHGTWLLFVFCDTAEVIQHMNDQIIDSFYNTEWYLLLPKSRKELLFILTLCQRKYKVKSFGMYVVNLNLFIFALRTVYSALNIIVATQKK